MRWMKAFIYGTALSFLFANEASAYRHDDNAMAVRLLCELVSQIAPLPSVEECQQNLRSEKGLELSLLHSENNSFRGRDYADARNLYYKLFVAESYFPRCREHHIACFDVSLLHSENNSFRGRDYSDVRNLYYRLFIAESYFPRCREHHIACFDVSLLYSENNSFRGRDYSDARNLYYRLFIAKDD